MHSADVVKLARSGRHFTAISHKTYLQLHAMRRFLSLFPDEERQQDGGVVPCQDDEELIAKMFEMIRLGAVTHTEFDRDKAVEVSFSEVPSKPYLVSPQPIAEGFKASEIPVEKTFPMEAVTGHSTRSIGVFKKNLTGGTMHRAAIEIRELPSMGDALVDFEAGSPPRSNGEGYQSPYRNKGSHYSNKALHPECCFGIYCPTLNCDGIVPGSLTYVSANWLGIYWGDGNSTPQKPMIGYVTRGGQPVAEHLAEEILLRPGDVLAIELRVKSTGLSAHFLLNGRVIHEMNASRQMPFAKAAPEDCFFGVQASKGATIATLGLPV